ncbi:MAG: chlorophyllide a reductase iron protein subunit X [Candidatus Velthaea sp.]|jgi:chlorophyllide reductase iron protein subunit X
MGVSKNSTVAIYGKGGAGKSFLTSMTAKTLTERGFNTLQMGCDPKHDSVVTHFGGALIPTVLGTWAQYEKEGRADDLAPEHIIFKGNGVYCIELGGPESARGCGGRGITFGFSLLEKWGLSEWNFDYMLLDFLGDVVCGGFGTPIARSMADKLIIVCSNEGQSMYAANNIASAVRYFAEQGGKTRCLGLVVNKDDGSGKAQAMAKWLGIPVIASMPLIPQDEVVIDGVPNEAVRSAVDNVIAAIDDLDAVVPNKVDFVQFMMHLSGNAAEMDGTAVTADELWSLPEVVPKAKKIQRELVLAGIPNGGRADHRYIEAEGDGEKVLGPTIVSVGGGNVPAADWG